MCRFPAPSHGVMVDAAVKAINHSFGNGIDPAQTITFQAQSFCPELQVGLGNHRSLQQNARKTIG